VLLRRLAHHGVGERTERGHRLWPYRAGRSRRVGLRHPQLGAVFGVWAPEYVGAECQELALSGGPRQPASCWPSAAPYRSTC